jgi:integrase/recombinase XerD
MSTKPTVITQEPAEELTPYSAEISVTRPGIDRELFDRRLEAWKDYLSIEEGAPENTYSTYAKEVKRFIDWLELNPQGIEKITFISYRNDLRAQYSPATVNLSLVAVRRFLDWLETEGEIPYNPATGVKGIKDPGRGKTHKKDDLTPAEVRRVLGAIDTSTLNGKRDYAIASAMAYGALRTIETHRAKIRDYQTKSSKRVLWVHEKGSADAEDYKVVHPKFESALAQWLADHPRGDDPEAPLFCSLSRRSYGKALSTVAIRHMIKGYYRKAGIREATKTTHSLRHSAITAVIRAGGSLLQAQRVAGHNDPKTTEKYIHDYDRLEDPAEFLIEY